MSCNGSECVALHVTVAAATENVVAGRDYCFCLLVVLAATAFIQPGCSSAAVAVVITAIFTSTPTQADSPRY